jgi:tetratricopeptide (TPR) repeat protein
MNKHLKALSVSAIAVLTISFQASAQNVEEGLKQLDAERYNASGMIFKQLVATAPTAESYFYLGYYYLNTPEPKLDSAKMAFEKGAAIDPKKPDPLCRVGLGAVKLGMRDRVGAKADFDLVTKDTKSKNPDVLFRIGEAYTLFKDTTPPFDTNDPAEAVRNIDLAFLKKKDAAAYYVAMADAYLIKNDGGPAMTNLENAMNLPTAKNLAKLKSKMGQVWVQGKNFQKALDNYNDAIKADPTFAPVYRQLGNFYVAYQNFPKAAENYRKYLELADTDDAAKLRYIKAAFVAKDYENELRVIDEIKGRVKDPILQRLAGFANFELGKPEMSIPLINEWLEKAGKDKDGKDRIFGMDYGYRGRSFAALKDVDKKKINDSLAILDMQKAIDMGDTTYNYYPDIAKIQNANKNFKGAIVTYRKMISTSKKESMSDNTLLGQALYNDGRISKDTNTLAESEKIWLKLTDFYKEKYPIAAYFQGNSRRLIEGAVPTGKAVPVLTSYVNYVWAEKDKPANKRYLVDVCNYIGNVALLFKDLPKAAEYYKKTLELDPANAEAIQGLAAATGTPAPTPVGTPPNGAAAVPPATPIKNTPQPKK